MGEYEIFFTGGRWDLIKNTIYGNITMLDEIYLRTTGRRLIPTFKVYPNSNILIESNENELFLSYYDINNNLVEYFALSVSLIRFH